jgi:hypothetical protein
MKFPQWWNWELEITSHILKRMENRNLTEIDLRGMLETASDYWNDIEECRFVIVSRLKNKDWEIIVEPDCFEKILVIITAYPKEM